MKEFIGNNEPRKIDKNIDLRNAVSKTYGEIASSEKNDETISKTLGYTEEELKSVPKDANMGLGCGNPHLYANISQGETVVDLGSGAGFDCFLSSNKVGKDGIVIGVDMTPEMIKKSRQLALNNEFFNVDFRLGEIENLPIADNAADVVISNCVINLSPSKQRVYDEIYRILKPGGRIAISDIILVSELTDDIKKDESLYCG